MREFWDRLRDRQDLEVGQIRRMVEEAEAALPYLRSRGSDSAHTQAVDDIEYLRRLLRTTNTQTACARNGLVYVPTRDRRGAL